MADFLFPGFLFGGFEGTAGWVNGTWIDAIKATQHDRFVKEDYARLKGLGISGVRESIRWPLVEKRPGRYNFECVQQLVMAAREKSIGVLWDLFHFGYPLFHYPLGTEFAARFAEYCRACALYLKTEYPGPYYLAPVNEPSFLSFAGGDAGRFAPGLTECGVPLKMALVHAAIEGINALRSVLPDCRIINIDPICRVVAPSDSEIPDDILIDFNERQVFEAWDIISGALRPELGGSRKHLDIIGINYYWTNQWEYGHPERLLKEDDNRHLPLSALIRMVWERYGAEIAVTETSHWEEARGPWMETMRREAAITLLEGLPLVGMCIYPIIGMFDWYSPSQFVPMGLWDIEENGDDLERVPYRPALEVLMNYHSRHVWNSVGSITAELETP